MGKDKTLNGKYSGDKLKNDIAEELADVALLSGEVAYLLGISDEEILTRMHYKIDRTEGRM